MNFTSNHSQQIFYEKDPSISSELNFQQIHSRLEAYNEINRTTRQSHKKIKKTILKTNQFQKQKKTQAHSISNILKKVRKNNIVQQFINKLKLNITLNSLNAEDEIQYFSIGKTSLQEDFRKKIRQGKAYKLFQNENFEILTIIIKFFTMMGIFYINSLKIVFQGLIFLDFVLKFLIIFSICFFCLEITGMMRKINNAKISFWKNFLYWIQKQHIVWQIIIHLGFVMEFLDFPFIQTIMAILLLPHVIVLMKKFKRVEHSFVLTINLEKYYELLKIVLFNFCIAHILSILLNLMGSTQFYGQKSWYSQKNINFHEDWYVKYIWGYYWGTTIMLTVGFGDISAQNHIEALILIFIETFACMIMAYNISEVSKIIQNISEMDQERKLKFKVFNQMSQKYNFQDNFKTNVLNHIDKSIQKKQELTYIEQSLIEELPQKIKLEVKRQVNKNVFKEAYFFRNLTRKTQNLLAEKVNKIFAHPEEFILKNMQTWKILILRQGSVAITFKKGSSVNNGTVIEQFTVEEISKPELLSLKFIRKYRIKGDLKSQDFSILNALEIEHFENILKDHDMHMFEFYCSERDKTQYHHFDLQIKKCSICINSKHDKITCPKMHFIPLKQHIIYKKKFADRGKKNHRNELWIERKYLKENSLMLYHEFAKDNTLISTQSKFYGQFFVPSLQLMGSLITDSNEISKKIDKCIDKVEEGLKILKGMTENSQQLQVDSARNYKRYFAKHNPDNLIYLNSQQSKGSRKLSQTQKKIHISSIL